MTIIQRIKGSFCEYESSNRRGIGYKANLICQVKIESVASAYVPDDIHESELQKWALRMVCVSQSISTARKYLIN